MINELFQSLPSIQMLFYGKVVLLTNRPAGGLTVGARIPAEPPVANKKQ